ncbi:TPA: hypothetical protein L4R60_002246 [Pseudomonas aeruginosa]|nr:hypothetical protein [Pseudomonas aeruginosa]
MSSTQHQLIEQCATRLRGIVEALDNIHDTSPHRWSTDLDDVHSSAESLLALIKDEASAQDAQGLALRTIAEYPCPEQDNMTAANMRQVAADAITGALAFGAQASQAPAADHWLRPFYDIGRAEGQRTQELAMLVRMLASSLKRHAPDSNLVARATNYLAAKGLAGTPLRDPPAPVKQAGGDERAAFEAWATHLPMDRQYLRPDLYMPPTQWAWDAWQARAALAQPSPAPTLRAAIDVANDRFEVPVAKWGTDLAGEEERPEVVAFIHERTGTIANADMVRAMEEGSVPSGYTVGLMTVAQHERIVASRWEHAMDLMGEHVARISVKLTKESDAALARVAELELKLDQSDYAYDNDRHHMRGMAKQAAEAIQVFTGHDSGANLAHRYGEKWWEHLDELRDALLAFAKNAPPAQAQHSVPELLVRAEDFVSGFEDDDEQEGVSQLLADLRLAIGRVK